MSEICEKCGLPEQLCVCENIAKESQKLIVSTEKRKFGKVHTIVDGFTKDIDVKDLTKKLKNEFACGGTFKGGQIELLGNHAERVKAYLAKHDFAI